MHKWVILLTKATDRAEAVGNAHEFLSEFQDKVWDRYQIWGRRTSTLAPDVEKFYKFASTQMKNESWFGFSTKDVEEKQPELQAEWERMWMEWPNPYADHYSLPNDWGVYDVMPLKECQEVVKSWIRNLDEEKEKLWEQMIEAKESAKQNENGNKYSDMSWYYANRYAEAQYGSFCFDSNVYDITVDLWEEMPKDIEWYRAVMVDMHN